MQFHPTPIDGAFTVELDKIEDERGYFARAFCQREWGEHHLTADVVQANLSHNRNKGTLRGMHYQESPSLETKFVRCIRGSIVDVIVDMRTDSPTYLKHFSVELTDNNGTALFVPALCAHGFITLEDNTDVFYLVSGFYDPSCERGLRHDDPALNINWPETVNHVSEKDQSWPLLSANSLP